MLHLGFFDTSAWMCAESASILELLTSSHSEKYRWYTGAKVASLAWRFAVENTRARSYPLSL